MNNDSPSDSPARSLELLDEHRCVLLVVDVQDKLLELMEGSAVMIWNCRRLIRAARVLSVPVAATVQYPEKLGGMSQGLVDLLPDAQAKRQFSCAECSSVIDPWTASGRDQVLVCGMEAHVCVLQTCADLLAQGYRVFVAADAVASRGELDYRLALSRLETMGAAIVTTEMAMFEWSQTSARPEFKQISALVREQPPVATPVGGAR